LPVSSDAEWPLPNIRAYPPGGPKGNKNARQQLKPRHHHFESFAADLDVACACFDEFADLCAPRLQESVDPLNPAQQARAGEQNIPADKLQ
jgi:hypothetical protein